MVTTPLSAGGAWSLFNGATTSHLSVDLQGYFAAQSGSSGRVTTVNPVKVYGAGGLGANATATVNVSSKLSGIANPVAVYVNVSLTGVKGTGYLTASSDCVNGSVGAVCCLPLSACANATEFDCCASTATFRPSCVGGQLGCAEGQARCGAGPW